MLTGDCWFLKLCILLSSFLISFRLARCNIYICNIYISLDLLIFCPRGRSFWKTGQVWNPKLLTLCRTLNFHTKKLLTYPGGCGHLTGLWGSQAFPSKRNSDSKWLVWWMCTVSTLTGNATMNFCTALGALKLLCNQRSAHHASRTREKCISDGCGRKELKEEIFCCPIHWVHSRQLIRAAPVL